MSLRTIRRVRHARRGALIASLVVACGTLGASTASAVPVSLTLNYTCTFPLIKPEQLQLKISSDIPASQPLGVSTGAFAINATAAVSAGAAYGLSAVDTASIEGSASAKASVSLPGGLTLPLRVPTTIAKTTLPASGGFTTTAVGQTPPLTFSQAGLVTIKVNDLLLNLTPRLADGTLTGLDTFETECIQNPGQNNTLATINAGGTSPTTPPTTTTQPPIAYGYSLAGTATLKTLVKGTLPLTGTIDANLTLATGAFTADLALNPTSAKLTALGFLPVTASVNMLSTAPVTGTLKSGVLNANAKVRIKLPKVTLAGVQLAGGSGCQAKQISSINLKSTDAFFNPLNGGTLSGTFAISDLVNCGFLTGIVSPLTKGSGNAIALKLTPKPVA